MSASVTVVQLGEAVKPTRPRVKPTDYPELPFIGMEHVEAGSVVANTIRRVPIAYRSRELNVRWIARPRELPRIAEQILKRHPEEPSIAVGDEIVGDHGLDTPIGLGTLQLEIDAASQRAQVDPLVPELVARDASQGQQGIDHLSHGLG